MKIGIITFWWSDENYGQQLQVYALNKYLKNQGHEPFLIRYYMNPDLASVSFWRKITKIFNPIKLIRYICSKVKLKLVEKQNRFHPRYFNDFRNETIQQSRIYNSYEELKNDLPDADCYIVGSDQVWNPACTTHDFKNRNRVLQSFFLDFVPDSIPRLAYAASFGTINFPKEWLDFVTPMLQKFSFISVREKSGVMICNNCMRTSEKMHDNVHWVCDPTLLLSSLDYRTLYKLYQAKDRSQHLYVKDHSEERYILLYYVDNGGEFNIDAVYDFAKEKGLNVYYITANGYIDKYSKIFPNVPQWLELVDHATYVITNSFHCCVFSIIFHKQFCAIPLNGKNGGMNDRLNSLFEICRMKPRLVYLKDRSIDFSILDEVYDSRIDTSGGKILNTYLSHIGI